MDQKVIIRFLLGILVVVCIQKPSHHFLQTFRPLRIFYSLCSAIVHRIRISCLYFVYYGWSLQALTALATYRFL